MEIERQLEKVREALEGLMIDHKVSVQLLIEEDRGDDGHQVWGSVGANKEADVSEWMSVMIFLCSKHKELRALDRDSAIARHILTALHLLRETDNDT